MRVALAAVLLLALPLASASHVPCPPQDCLPLQPIPRLPYLAGSLEVPRFDVQVAAIDGLATTRFTVELRNPDTVGREATFNLAVPPGAAILALNLTDGAKLLEARVQEKAAAQANYTQATEQGRAAVLLREVADGLLSLSAFVPAGESRTLRAAYVEWVPAASGTLVYRLPLDQVTAQRITVQVHVQAASGFEALRAFGLELAFDRTAGAQATASASFEATSLPELVLTWRPAERRSSIVAAAHGPDVPAVAEICLPPAKALARDVVFVLDRSGSMAGAKIVQARESMRTGLLTVGAADRFGVVLFDSHIEALGGMATGTSAEIEADRSRLAEVAATGGTDIDGGLQKALELLGPHDTGRLPMVVLVTDGLPSAGVTDHDAIIERYKAANARGAVVHVVPIGLDADHTFLADLALQSGGAFFPMDAGDVDLAARLARLYDVVGHTVLAEPEVTLGGSARLLDVPVATALEDGCIRFAFTMDTSQTLSVRLAGRDANGRVEMASDFAPGMLRIDQAAAALHGRAEALALLSRERMEGIDLRAAIIEAAISSRQLTPYTSWVIADLEPQPDDDRRDEERGRTFQHQSAMPSSAATATSPPMGTGTGLTMGTGAVTGTVDVYHDFAAGKDDALQLAEQGAGTAAGTSAQTPLPAWLALGAALLAVALAGRRRLA